MSFVREGSSGVWSRCKCFQAETVLGVRNPILCMGYLDEVVTSAFPYLSQWMNLQLFTSLLSPHTRSPITKSHTSGSQQDADFTTRQQPDYAQLWLLVLGTPCNTSRDVCEEFHLGCLKFFPSVVKSDLSVTLALPVPSWCLLVREPN